MFAANTFRIRLAAHGDAFILRRLAEAGSRPPLEGRVLIGEIDGRAAAAMSVDDGRVVADPSRSTDHLVAVLRVRAQALQAYEATPSLSQRMIAALPAAYRAPSAPVLAAASTNGHIERSHERVLVST